MGTSGDMIMPETIERELPPGVTFHPRSPDASPEKLHALAGIIKLTPPLTLYELHAFIHDEEDEDEEDECAGR